MNGKKDGNQDQNQDSNVKPPLIVRFWHSLRRRRVWLNIGQHPKANVAEKVTVFITFCILIVGCIQVYIYWRQTRVMQNTLRQNERSIILNMGQVAIANRNAKTAEEALANTQQQFRTEERPWIMAYGGMLPESQPSGIVVRPNGDVELRIRIEGKNIGKTPAVDVEVMPYELRISSTRTIKRELESFVPTYEPALPGDNIPPDQGGQGFVIEKKDFEKIKTYESIAYLVGAVRYRDVFSPKIRKYETIFCVQYKPRGMPIGSCGAGKFGIK
jgi:hypothetical protein